VRGPLSNAAGQPAYCAESMKWHEEKWDIPEEQKDLFSYMSHAFYNMLHRALTSGARWRSLRSRCGSRLR